MRLISAVLGFVLGQLGRIVLMVLAMFLVVVLVQAVVPSLRETMADRERLQQVTAERKALERRLDESVDSLEEPIQAQIEEGRRNVSEKAAELDDLRHERDEACGFWEKVIAVPLPGNACKSAEAALAKADEALDDLEAGVKQAEEHAAVLQDPDLTTEQKLELLREDGDEVVGPEIADTAAELDQKEAEESSLEQAQDSATAWLVDLWLSTWRWLLALAVLFLLAPFLLRTFAYFVLMPLVSRVQRPVRLLDDDDRASASLVASEAQRTLAVEVNDGQVLSARSEHVRPVEAAAGKVRSRVLYDWSAPFISYAAGLHGLTRLTGDDPASVATLATPDDPDSYLMRIDFADHPGLVMHPRHIVGVMGTPELQTRWRWGIQALATGQVRYIMFTGTGSLIVQGSGDVVAVRPQRGSIRMEQHLVMGFDSRLSMSVKRTEVFWPYLWGRTPLVDDQFAGPHLVFWQKSNTAGSSNPLVRTFDAFFSAIGKLLGF